MISTLIFDNDGVLVDTERLFFEANRGILEAEEIELTTAYYRQTSLRQGGSC
ncbi:MAG: HAD family phosphatase, partial [Calditrichaeota bacterium]